MLSMVEFTRKWGRHRQKWLGDGRASQVTQGNGNALQHGKVKVLFKKTRQWQRRGQSMPHNRKKFGNKSGLWLSSDLLL